MSRYVSLVWTNLYEERKIKPPKPLWVSHAKELGYMEHKERLSRKFNSEASQNCIATYGRYHIYIETYFLGWGIWLSSREHSPSMHTAFGF